MLFTWSCCSRKRLQVPGHLILMVLSSGRCIDRLWCVYIYREREEEEEEGGIAQTRLTTMSGHTNRKVFSCISTPPLWVCTCILVGFYEWLHVRVGRCMCDPRTTRVACVINFNRSKLLFEAAVAWHFLVVYWRRLKFCAHVRYTRTNTGKKNTHRQ